MKNNLTKGQSEYLEKYDYSKNLIFGGTVWSWKTYEAIKLLNNYENKSVFKITDAYFKELLWNWSLKLKKPDEWNCSYDFFPLEKMIKVKILLFDDLWVSDSTEAYLRKLTFVLDERKEKGLITIFTTNFTAEWLQKKLNERIKSRVFENVDILNIIWPDLREWNINNIK